VIETDRLVLRPLALDDAAALVALFAGDWEAVKQTGRIPYPPDEDSIRDWLKLHDDDAKSFAVLLKPAGAFAGIVGYGGDGETAEVGYAFGRGFWGRGYATEAVAALSVLARRRGLIWIEAFSFVENPASARVLAKAGFGELGTVVRNYPARGGPRRVRHFRLWFRDRPQPG